jgi:hypothetical protein
MRPLIVLSRLAARALPLLTDLQLTPPSPSTPEKKSARPSRLSPRRSMQRNGKARANQATAVEHLASSARYTNT